MEMINCIGEACPLPVIKTKKALRENNRVTVLVDNEIATQNLAKMSKQLGFTCQTTQLDEKKYNVVISKDGTIEEEACDVMTSPVSETGEYIVAVSSNQMGGGEEELGKILIKGFLYALTEQDVLPKKILFYNSGVYLATKNSDSLEDLRQLADKGVEIESCGLCADYYQVKDKLAVGSVTNMYSILETMRQYHTVKPS